MLTDPETNIVTVQPPKSEEQLEAELAEDTEVTTADDVAVDGEEGEGGAEEDSGSDASTSDATGGEKKDS